MIDKNIQKKLRDSDFIFFNKSNFSKKYIFVLPRLPTHEYLS